MSLLTTIDALIVTVIATSLFEAGDLVGFDGAKITADDQPVLGYAKNPCTEIGQPIALLALGVARIKATGAIAVGAKVVSSSGGGVETAPADPDNAFATALTAAADGEFTSILIR